MLLQKLRLQRGWSQQQLAELSGLSVRTIQRIENGSMPSTESLKSLASVFEIDFSILSSETAMPSASTRTQDERIALRQVRQLKRFCLHLLKYLIVITLLAAINLLVTPHILWFYWPALGWGIGIACHAAATLQWMPFFDAAWEKKQLEKRLGVLSRTGKG
ncbi:MAG TPA: helix-turn-helix domain-containing protein [Comamonas sp.]